MENQDIAWSEFIGFWEHGYISQGQDQNDAWSLRKRRYTAPIRAYWNQFHGYM